MTVADVAITAASVLPGSGAVIVNGTAGETLTAGMGVYLKTDGKYWKSQADGTAAEATVAGVVLNGASAGQPVSVQTGGTVTIGGTVVVGTVYTVSATAGGICPITDLVSTNYLSVLGAAPTAGTITLKPWATGIVKA